MGDILTSRLRLVPVSTEMRAAMQSSRHAFAALTGMRLPEGWPQFPEAFHPITRPPELPWSGYLFLDKHNPILLGNGGFYGAPAGGVVEFGYEIAPPFRNRGYATEVAEAFLTTAFSHGARLVQAHSLAGANASNAVMRKIGMQFRGESEQDGVSVWLWQRMNPATE